METIIPSKDDLLLWWSNLDPAVQGRIDYDYRDQYEGGFPSGESHLDLEWLGANHPDAYEALLEFVGNGWGEVVLRARDAATKQLQSDEVLLDDPVRVLLPPPDKDHLKFSEGSFVQVWQFVRARAHVKVTIWPDEDDEGPNEWGGWHLYSFNTRHSNFQHPDKFKLGSHIFKEGLAFRLSYYEHGESVWFLQGEGGAGTDCPFDSVSFAGVLVWEDLENKPWDGHYQKDPKTGQDRLNDQGKRLAIPKEGRFECAKLTARRFCEAYTTWVNGRVLGYSMETSDGNGDSSVGGFFRLEDLVQDVINSVPEDVSIEWLGDAADTAASIFLKLKKNGE